MKDALVAIPSTHCEVFITDLGLPDGNGWELLAQAQFPQPVYAVAISGYGTEADLERSRQAGFRRHLTKPYAPKDLTEAVDAAAREMGASPSA